MKKPSEVFFAMMRPQEPSAPLAAGSPERRVRVVDAASPESPQCHSAILMPTRPPPVRGSSGGQLSAPSRRPPQPPMSEASRVAAPSAEYRVARPPSRQPVPLMRRGTSVLTRRQRRDRARNFAMAADEALARSRDLGLATVRRHPLMIDPTKYPRRLGAWDCAIGLSLVWVAVVTPFEAAFLEAATSPTELLFIIGRFIDLIFVVDFCLQFVLMVRVPTKDGLKWVDKPSQIAARTHAGARTLSTGGVVPGRCGLAEVPESWTSSCACALEWRWCRTPSCAHTVLVARAPRDDRLCAGLDGGRCDLNRRLLGRLHPGAFVHQ